jgi:hypothetical protein
MIALTRVPAMDIPHRMETAELQNVITTKEKAASKPIFLILIHVP